MADTTLRLHQREAECCYYCCYIKIVCVRGKKKNSKVATKQKWPTKCGFVKGKAKWNKIENAVGTQ